MVNDFSVWANTEQEKPERRVFTNEQLSEISAGLELSFRKYLTSLDNKQI
jgi:hypothetical protein